MNIQPVHIHKTRRHSTDTLLFLLIPILAFALVLLVALLTKSVK